MRVIPFVIVLGACKLGPQPAVARFEPAKIQVVLPAVATSAVKVIEASAPTDTLPSGLHLEQLSLFADPSFPSPASPHRVLGRVTVTRNKHHTRDEYLAVMQAEAAKHGANTLVLVDEAGTRCTDPYGKYCRLGYAVALSDAPVATFPPANAVLASWRKSHGALRPHGEPKVVDLAAPSFFEIVPRRGECLTFVLALDGDARAARFRDRTMLTLETKSSYLGFNRRESSPEDWGSKDRVLALDAGCAQGSDRVAFAFRNTFRNHGEPPGHGKALVQVFVRTVDGKTLEKQERALAEAERRSIEWNAAMQQEACDECIGEWRRCVIADPDVKKGRCERFNSCVQRRYAKPARCDVR